MKRNLVFLLLFIFLAGHLCGQKIQYSKGGVRVDRVFRTDLVTNLGGYHHLVTFNAKEKPSIYIFNDQLTLLGQKQIDYIPQQGCDVKVLSFPGYYFLYLHPFHSPEHLLWKIDGQGMITSLSDRFEALIDSTIGKTSVTLQLVNENDSLYVLSHTYYDAVKHIVSRVVRPDSALGARSFWTVAFPFDIQSEALQRVALSLGHLFVLKTRDEEGKGNYLDLIRMNLSSGELLTNSFNSANHEYTYCGFDVIRKDTSVLVHAIVKEPDYRIQMSRTILIARLNSQLQEQPPLALLKSQFVKSTGTDFLLVGGDRPVWINMHNIMKRLPELALTNESRLDVNNDEQIRNYLDYTLHYTDLTGIRLTRLDEGLKVRADSIAADRKSIEIQPYPFAEARLDNKNYLVLIQNFSHKRNSLLIFSGEDPAHFQSYNIPVFDRFDYVLTQLRTVNGDYFIVPYIDNKDEMGLMKVIFKKGNASLLENRNE